MLRLSQIKLPLDHSEAALEEAILKKLHVAAADRTGAGGSLIVVIGFALGQ